MPVIRGRSRRLPGVGKAKRHDALLRGVPVELEVASLVAPRTVIDPDGNHHKQFRAILEGLILERGDELRVDLDVAPSGRSVSGNGRDLAGMM